MRGKPERALLNMRLAGLIPACAGKTTTGFTLFMLRRAHPRVCGENLGTSTALAHTPGSSPRVRGKPVQLVFYAGTVRLIPACAGKTLSDTITRPDGQAHPRVCGENATPISS